MTDHIPIVKIKGRKLANRKEVARVLGISAQTFRTYLYLKKIPEAARVVTAIGEMWDVDILFQTKVAG